MNLLDKILKIIDELENEYDLGGGEDETGGLEPGYPDWDKAREQITHLFKQEGYH